MNDAECMESVDSVYIYVYGYVDSVKCAEGGCSDNSTRRALSFRQLFHPESRVESAGPFIKEHPPWEKQLLFGPRQNQERREQKRAPNLNFDGKFSL